jgi:biotin carboxylase
LSLRDKDVVRLLILGAGPTQEPAIRRARELGCEVVAVDGDPQAPGLALAHHALRISTLDLPAILAEARRLKPDGVMTVGSDRAVNACSQVAHALGLPGLDPAAAAKANSKLRMRQAFRDRGVPAPAFVPVEALAAAERAVEQLGLPVVIKPVDNAAQRGVQRLDNAADLPSAFIQAQRFSSTGMVLVEEYIDGPEVTVSSFSLGGRMYPVLIADRLTNPPPYLGIALAHVYPSQRASLWQEQVLEVTAQGLDALGIDQGPGYSQLRIDGDGPKIMEIGARIGGGRETELISLLGGPDWMAAQIKLALGEPVRAADVLLPDYAKCRAGAIMFIFSPPGEAVQVTGLDRAQQVPGIARVSVRTKPGTVIPPMTSAEARQGYLIALGASRDEALARAEAAAACVHIEVRPTAADGSDNV